MRSTARALGAGIAATCVALSMHHGSPPAYAADPAGTRPNIVLIMVDDMGFSDIGCYGGEIETPTLDRLAAQGMRFTQFYNAAKCAQTRASLMTGCYHREVGVKKMANAMTLAEAMRAAQYTTLATGKWHLDGHPLDRGFDRFFGHLSPDTNYFSGDETFYLDRDSFRKPGKRFYTTDANVYFAIEFLKEAVQGPNPFFLYIAFNAPHYPLQAWPKDIDKYRGKYMQGWDRLRRKRHARQVEAGLVDPEWGLPPRDGQAWDALTEKQKREEDLTMAVYAAMIDRVDRTIGRLQAKLTELGAADDTLTLFLSDNGACPFPNNRIWGVPPGPKNSFRSYHKKWAQLSNTPFRNYKQNQHEGGISTPLIAHWPGHIEGGSITHQPGHVVDIMATLLEIAGLDYPESRNGVQLRPLRGKSLAPVFRGKQRAPHTELFFEHREEQALRKGDWKIVRSGGAWELYNISADRTEMHDLAPKMPAKTRQLADRFTEWMRRSAPP